LYNHPLIQILGPEPLSSEFNLNYLYKKTRNSATNIKNFIMNQKNVVGIGNIYASETLFLSNIRPTRKAGRISKNECQKIINNSKKVLRSAIRKGGTTLRDFYSADGNQGYFQINLNVYGRDNEICNNCKAKIKKIVLNNRAAYFCANCQS
jgi:formamidopyrimidine-DNA glycosylase